MPIQPQNWLLPILSHPDSRFAAYIYEGLTTGFRIGFDRKAPPLIPASRNHPSSSLNRPAVRAYIQEEVAAGRLVGPLGNQERRHIHSSPIGLVPKSSQPGRWRLIVDLSFPPEHSINNGVSPELSSIKYASVDDAVAYIIQLGRVASMVKLDLGMPTASYLSIPRTNAYWPFPGKGMSTLTGHSPLALDQPLKSSRPWLI